MVADNGGNTSAGASNHPLKGMKSDFYEGGIRVAGFVNSPLLSQPVNGTEFHGLMGIADWFPTIIEGIAEGSKEYTTDGVNMWDSLRLVNSCIVVIYPSLRWWTYCFLKFKENFQAKGLPSITEARRFTPDIHI